MARPLVAPAAMAILVVAAPAVTAFALHAGGASDRWRRQGRWCQSARVAVGGVQLALDLRTIAAGA